MTSAFTALLNLIENLLIEKMIVLQTYGIPGFFKQ